MSVPSDVSFVSLVWLHGSKSYNRCEVLFASNISVDSMSDHVMDVARHAGTEKATGPIPQPTIGGSFTLDKNVVNGKHSISGLSSYFEPLLVN